MIGTASSSRAPLDHSPAVQRRVESRSAVPRARTEPPMVRRRTSCQRASPVKVVPPAPERYGSASLRLSCDSLPLRPSDRRGTDAHIGCRAGGRSRPVRPRSSFCTRTPVVAGGAGAVLIGAALVAPSVALLMAPALLLTAVLALGRFPGESVIHRLRARRWPTAPPRRASSVRLPRFVPRASKAGVTLAFSLAVRPPPLRAALTI